MQRSYGNQALILQDWGRLDEALALLKKKETICKELGNRTSLALCHWGTALVLRDMAKKDASRAADLLAKARDRVEMALGIFTELKMPGEIEATRKLLDELGGL